MANVNGLSVSAISAEGSRGGNIKIDLSGVDGDDFVACADDRLIDEIVRAAGEDKAREIFGLVDGDE